MKNISYDIQNIKEYRYSHVNSLKYRSSILIINDNELDYLKISIESIRKFTNKDDVEIIVIDNNSDEENQNWLNSQSDIIVLYNKEELDYERLYVKGIELSKGENIVILENGILMTPRLMENLEKALYSDDNIGIVTPMLSEFSTDTILQKLEYANIYNQSSDRLWDYCSKLNTYCCMMRRKVFYEIKDIDNYIDSDLISNRFDIMLCKDIVVLQITEEKDRYTSKNPDVGSIKQTLINLISTSRYEKFNVLYIGNNIKDTVFYIKNKYRKCNIYGIDINTDLPNKQNRFIRIEDINNLSFSYDNQVFDHIFIENALEKSINPKDILEKLSSILKPDGTLISLIANIMNVDVLCDLICGQFTYQDSGILDKQNLRFFTNKEINNIFNKCDYSIQRTYKVACVLDSIVLKKAKILSSISSESLMEQFVTLDFIVVAKKNIDEKVKLKIENEKYKHYLNYLFEKDNINSSYEDTLEEGFEYKDGDSKVIAYYLPQFHNDENNNIWWGRGSTEWDNVTRSIPQFADHYQPRLPKDMGFYDLELKDNLKRQIELAKNGGVYGFAIYYYYLANKLKVLRKPLDIILDNKDLNIPFCIYWGNHNWTKQYQSDNKDVLAMQFNTCQEYKETIHDMQKYLRDDRYIKINGKKLIMIHCSLDVPNSNEVFNYWREYCRVYDLGEIYIMASKEYKSDDVDYYKQLGYDGVNEFNPNSEVSKYSRINQEIDFIRGYYGSVFDAEEYIEQKKYIDAEFRDIYKCIIPSWDNTPRKVNCGWIFKGTSPSLYYKWLVDIMKLNKINPKLDDDIVFINAWNEWGEGAILEPCSKYGYSYLNATKRAIEDIRNNF